MEWIVISAKTVPQAVERALDTLGVHETELEFEVIEEAKAGFLGIRRADAKIKARVKPISREKPNDKRRRQQKERRTRSGPRDKAQGEASAQQSKANATSKGETADDAGSAASGEGEHKAAGASNRSRNRNRNRGGQNKGDRPNPDAGDANDTGRLDDDSTNDTRDSTSQTTANAQKAPRPPKREATPVATGTIEEQMTHARDFAEGFLTAWGIEGAVAVGVIADDVVEVAITGSNLGLLVGPKGATLASIEELLRGSVGHRGPARLHLDVAGYRSKRREALANFARTVAQQVLETGAAKALEPMSSQDRKVVHDAITEMEGVTTISDGEDARRRVVIQPSA